jgi:hypothetical protein
MTGASINWWRGRRRCRSSLLRATLQEINNEILVCFYVLIAKSLLRQEIAKFLAPIRIVCV